jgi:hypothetical protein
MGELRDRERPRPYLGIGSLAPGEAASASGKSAMSMRCLNVRKSNNKQLLTW